MRRLDSPYNGHFTVRLMLRLGPKHLLAVLLLIAAAPLAAQRLDRPIRVFLDCSGFFCDQDYMVEEIPWVDFVRDRQDADVHALGTRQQTGTGGSAYTFELRGRGPLEGEQLTVTATTPADATDEDRRVALVEVIAMALAPLAQRTPTAPLVTVEAPTGEAGATESVDDPWDRWTFRLGVNGFLSGESQQRSISGFGSASANRITDRWKTLFSVRASMDRSEFELDDTTSVTARRRSYGANALVARSVGRHWGVGAIMEWTTSSFANYDASVVVGPAVEYNVFPFSESNRRLLTVAYAVGPRHNDYADATIFGATRETLLEQLLIVSYDVTQPWGSIDVSAQADHYLTSFGNGEAWTDPQFSAQVGGGLDVRLVRGLSTRINGRIAMVRNQIQLPAAGLTEEEILTQQRELATSYRYFASIGLSYRFGSIFSDVVNPRFGVFD